MKKKLLNTTIALGLGVTCTLAILQPSYAATPEVQIQIHQGHFIPSEFEIPANTKVKLVIINQDDTPEEFESYDLNREVLIKANSQASFYIGPLSPGRFHFEGEFSPMTAQGVVIVK
jgi:hypothetical protein